MKKVIISIIGIAAALGFLFYSSRGAAEHYKMVDQLMVDPSPYVGKRMRVHGHVTEGSIREQIKDQLMVRTFELHAAGKTIQVNHSGVVPDTFRDGSECLAFDNDMNDLGRIGVYWPNGRDHGAEQGDAAHRGAS